MEIHAVGDVNNDALADFIVAYNQCDTLFYGPNAIDKMPVRLALYHGARGGVPDPQSGTTLGADELSTSVSFLAAGRFDDDPYVDLALAISTFFDTTDGSGGYTTWRVVVYWGSETGAYTNADTTHLENGGRLWGLPRAGVIHRTFGLPDALVLWAGGTIINGVITPTAGVHVFESADGGRFGRDGRGRTARWSWWNAPNARRAQFIDHDGDQRLDIAFISDELVDSTTVTLLYGSTDGFFDTTATEGVSLRIANGRHMLFTDVTSDGVPELLTMAGSQELFKVFVGRRGHRLLEQYGTGIDPPDPGGGRPFARPWASIPLPKNINSGWPTLGFETLFDVGDVGRDRISDAVPLSRPDLFVYSTGNYFDEYIDAIIPVPGGSLAVTRAVRLGDIDGQGRPALAVFYGWIPGGIVFYRTNSCVEQAGGRYTPVPPGTGKPSGGVTAAAAPAIPTIAARLSPNPSRGRVRVEWDGPAHAGVSIYDAAGNEAARWSGRDHATDLDLSRWPRGAYRVQVLSREGLGSAGLALE